MKQRKQGKMGFRTATWNVGSLNRPGSLKNWPQNYHLKDTDYKIVG